MNGTIYHDLWVALPAKILYLRVLIYLMQWGSVWVDPNVSSFVSLLSNGINCGPQNFYLCSLLLASYLCAYKIIHNGHSVFNCCSQSSILSWIFFTCWFRLRPPPPKKKKNKRVNSVLVSTWWGWFEPMISYLHGKWAYRWAKLTLPKKKRKKTQNK